MPNATQHSQDHYLVITRYQQCMKNIYYLFALVCLITNRLHIPQPSAIHTYSGCSQQILYQLVAKSSHAFYPNLNKNDKRATSEVCKWIDVFLALSTGRSVSMCVDGGIMQSKLGCLFSQATA